MSRDHNVPNDLIEYTGGGLTSNNLYGVKNRPAKYIKAVTGGGSLEVIMAGSAGAQRTLTLAAGEDQIGEFITLVSATGITRVRVGWN